MSELYTVFFGLCKEIKYIAEHTTVCLIDLCISAYGTGYSCKFFALNIENFTPKASGGSEYSCFILVVLTLRTPVTDITHELLSFFVEPISKVRLVFRARRETVKKRSIHVVCEHFEPFRNTAMGT